MNVSSQNKLETMKQSTNPKNSLSIKQYRCPNPQKDQIMFTNPDNKVKKKNISIKL